MSKKLILFVDPSWRRSGIHSPLMIPWWGNPYGPESLFAKEMFDAHQFDTSAYEITDDISKAQMVFAPYRHNWLRTSDPALLQECLEMAKSARLPLLIDGVGDSNHPVRLPNTYVLRIGGYKFIPEPRCIQIPPPSDDLLKRVCGGVWEPRTKSEGKPVVGFAGWAHLTQKQRLRNFVKELPTRIRGFFDDRYQAMQKGVLWRERTLRVLERSPLVMLNLRVRQSFSGSTKTAQADMRQLRQELVDTVLNSDYCLDVRGDANDSTRLFEILSLGRIPVVLDTERRFPFAHTIAYRDFCLIIDFRRVDELPHIIAEFHASVSPEHFEQMQRACREAFVRHFRIDAQMRHIIEELKRVIPRLSQP